jgi:C_GCAxxG_C_C family probable redox protein
MNKTKLKKKLGERAYFLGYEYEEKYHGCAQCVAAAVQDTFHISNDDIFKSLTGFGGGGGGLCNGSCGAYAGGIAMFSWLAGRERTRFQDIDVSCTYDLTRRLHSRFIDKYGAIICRDINMKIFGRSFYTADPDEYCKFQEAGAYVDKCTDVVGSAAQWVTELIIEQDLVHILGSGD